MKHNFRQTMISKGSIVSNGIITNNPIFRLVIGTCPTLAITISAVNALGMGLATTFVLICSNALVSVLRRIIPDKVRIPAYVLIIATFVTVVEMVMRKYLPSLFDALGIYLPLIVVNCIIFARAESFASSNTVGDSVLDGLGMGLGFTIAILITSIIREFLGAGSFFYGSLAGLSMGVKFDALGDYAMNFFVMPAGGFMVFGFIMAAVNALTDRAQKKKDKQKELMKNKINADIQTANEEAAL